MVAFRPGQSPPEVRIPTRFFIQKPSFLIIQAKPNRPAKDAGAPGVLPFYSIRVFRKGSAVKRKTKNLQACVHRAAAAKTFAEKLKKWLTSSPPACIISLVSNARRG
jgi:hypothetical protein